MNNLRHVHSVSTCCLGNPYAAHNGLRATITYQLEQLRSFVISDAGR
jgi:hypothetical protein